MSHSQQISNSQQSSSPIGSDNGLAIFGSLSISFAAFMAMLEARLKLTTSMYELSSLNAKTGASVSISGYSAQLASATSNSKATKLQSMEQVSQAAVSGLGGAMSGFGCYKSMKSSIAAEHMENLSSKANGYKGRTNIQIGDDSISRDTTDGTREELAQDIRRRLIAAGEGGTQAFTVRELNEIASNGGAEDFDLRRLDANSSVTTNNTEGAVTLKNVLEDSIESEAEKMRAGLGKGHKVFRKEQERDDANVQQWNQLVTGLTGAANASATAGLKMGEAKQVMEKGVQDMLVSLNQNASALFQATQKAESDVAGQSSNTADIFQAMNSIGQLDSQKA